MPCQVFSTSPSMLPQQSLYHLKQCRLSNCFPECLESSTTNKQKEIICQDRENLIVADRGLTVAGHWSRVRVRAPRQLDSPIKILSLVGLSISRLEVREISRVSQQLPL